MAWPDDRFIRLVGSQYPIVQAPMAGAGGVELCIGAIEGGALGSLPCGLLSPDQVREQVRQVRERVRGPLNLNFFCHTMAEVEDGDWRALLAPFFEEYGVQPGGDAGAKMRLPFNEAMAEIVEEVRPEVVSFHFGLPTEPLLSRVKAAGAVIIGNATSVAEARWLTERGADALIAHGWEAGGHIGRFLGGDPAEALALFALLPQVADAVDIPVIAAGAVADARGIAAAFALGASAVQLGTAYLHCAESLISVAHRQAMQSRPTLVTNLYTGGFARGFAGRLVEELGPVRSEAPLYPHAASALAPIREAAEKEGEFGFGPMWAGQSASLGRELPARELTRQLASEALTLLRNLSQEH